MLGSALGEMLCIISPKPDGECCGCPGHAELLNLVPSYQTATSQWLPAVLVPGALCREVSWLVQFGARVEGPQRSRSSPCQGTGWVLSPPGDFSSTAPFITQPARHRLLLPQCSVQGRMARICISAMKYCQVARALTVLLLNPPQYA